MLQTGDSTRQITFTHKSRIYPKELRVNVSKPGQTKKSKKTVKVDQKQMVYYSEKYAKYLTWILIINTVHASRYSAFFGIENSF